MTSRIFPILAVVIAASGCPKSLRQYLFEKANGGDVCQSFSNCKPPQPSSLDGVSLLLPAEQMIDAGALSFTDPKVLAREWLFQIADGDKWARGRELCDALADNEIEVGRPISISYSSLSETIDVSKISQSLELEISLPPGIPVKEQPRIREQIAAMTTNKISQSTEGAGRIVMAWVTREAIRARNLNDPTSGFGAMCKSKAPGGFRNPVLFTGVTFFVFDSSLSESTTSNTKSQIIAEIQGVKLSDGTTPITAEAAAEIFASTEKALRTKLAVVENVGLMIAASNISLSQFTATATPQPPRGVSCTMPKGPIPRGAFTCVEETASKLLSSGNWERLDISGRFSTGMEGSNTDVSCRVQLAFGATALGVLEPKERGHGKNPITINRAFLRKEVSDEQQLTFVVSTPWECTVHRGGSEWLTGTPLPSVGELTVLIQPKVAVSDAR